jgi:hypothetical protein
VDLVAERRLGDVEPSGSAAEVQFLGDGQEVAQMTGLEIDSKRLSLGREAGLGHETACVISFV